MSTPQIDPYLRRPEVLKQTGIRSSTLNRMVKRGEFPAPKQLGVRAVGWRASTIKTWCDYRPDARSARSAEEAHQTCYLDAYEAACSNP